MEEEEIAEEKGAQAKRQKMMRVWIQKFGERATYLRFVEGCERIQRRDLEEAVCDLVRERIHEASGMQCRALPYLSQCNFIVNKDNDDDDSNINNNNNNNN